MVFGGSGKAEDLLESVSKQIRNQTQNYREVQRGKGEVCSQTVPLLEYTGVNPKGEQAHSQMAAFVAGGVGYVFLLSTPESEFATVQPVWKALLSSFNVGGPAASVTPTVSSPGDPVNAYYNMMDFIRTEAWKRSVTTSGDERQRVADLLQQGRGEMDQQTQAAIQQIPQTWTNLQKAWSQASKEKKDAQREFWRKQLLVPSQLFVPPAENGTFKGSNDRIVFDYPPNWVVAQTENEGTQYLYLGPPGTQASWDQVVNASTSPAGALFIVSPLDEELKSLNSYLEGARFIAQRFVTANAPDFKEIDAMELGEEGAVITLLGHYPGQSEETFFWVGVVRYGPDYLFAGRLGGPTSQAETLVPAFGCMLTTMELKPPGGGGGGGAGAATVDYYAARCGNIATSGPW
jgi:hypothetical protein